MAVIQSGASSDQLSIGPTSKAARVTLYDGAGNEIHATPTGSYILPFRIIQSAATAANLMVWAMRNGATKTVRIRKIKGSITFAGTAAAATQIGYDFRRFTAATPTGGTVLVPFKKRTGDPASSVADARFVDTGLTTTGITFENAFANINLPASVTGTVGTFAYDFINTNEKFSAYELAANEGLGILLTVTAIIGQAISGYVEYDEI